MVHQNHYYYSYSLNFSPLAWQETFSAFFLFSRRFVLFCSIYFLPLSSFPLDNLIALPLPTLLANSVNKSFYFSEHSLCLCNFPFSFFFFLFLSKNNFHLITRQSCRMPQNKLQLVHFKKHLKKHQYTDTV